MTSDSLFFDEQFRTTGDDYKFALGGGGGGGGNGSAKFSSSNSSAFSSLPSSGGFGRMNGGGITRPPPLNVEDNHQPRFPFAQQQDINPMLMSMKMMEVDEFHGSASMALPFPSNFPQQHQQQVYPPHQFSSVPSEVRSEYPSSNQNHQSGALDIAFADDALTTNALGFNPGVAGGLFPAIDEALTTSAMGINSGGLIPNAANPTPPFAFETRYSNGSGPTPSFRQHHTNHNPMHGYSHTSSFASPMSGHSFTTNATTSVGGGSGSADTVIMHEEDQFLGEETSSRGSFAVSLEDFMEASESMNRITGKPSVTGLQLLNSSTSGYSSTTYTFSNPRSIVSVNARKAYTAPMPLFNRPETPPHIDTRAGFNFPPTP